MGPALLAIRDHVWENPQQVLTVLRVVQRGDPYSKFLAQWIAVFTQLAHP
jgi:hypothetical protein